MRPTYLYLIFLLIVAVSGLFLVDGFDKRAALKTEVLAEKPSLQDPRAYVLPVSEPSLGPVLSSRVQAPIISGKSALIYDIQSGRILYEKNSNNKVPIASLTKILSAIIALETLDQKDVVVIPKEVVKVDEEKQDLYSGERITVSNLLKLMLIESSNDSAYALANHANLLGINFIDKMNQKAFSLGMFDSYFLDPAGLNDSAFSTASDLAKLVDYSRRYEIIWDIMKEKELIIPSEDEAITHIAKNTNKLLDLIPNVVGGKTGFTDGASGCLILITKIDDKNSVISIVLGSNDRFGDTVKIVNWAKAAYSWPQ